MQINLTSILDLLFILLFLFMAGNREVVVQAEQKGELMKAALNVCEGERNDCASISQSRAKDIKRLEALHVEMEGSLGAISEQVSRQREEIRRLEESKKKEVEIASRHGAQLGRQQTIEEIGMSIRAILQEVDKETLEKLLENYSMSDEKNIRELISALSQANSKNIIDSLAIYRKVVTEYFPVRANLNHSKLTLFAMNETHSEDSTVLALPSDLLNNFADPNARRANILTFRRPLAQKLHEAGVGSGKKIVVFSYDNAKDYERKFVLEVFDSLKERSDATWMFVNSGYYHGGD